MKDLESKASRINICKADIDVGMSGFIIGSYCDLGQCLLPSLASGFQVPEYLSIIDSKYYYYFLTYRGFLEKQEKKSLIKFQGGDSGQTGF